LIDKQLLQLNEVGLGKIKGGGGGTATRSIPRDGSFKSRRFNIMVQSQPLSQDVGLNGRKNSRGVYQLVAP